MTTEAGYPELLADMFTKLREILIKRGGLGAEKADECAMEAAEAIRRDWGGQIIYVPTGLGYDVMERDREIWSKFTGHNVYQLAKEYELTEIHIYRVIAKMRMLDRVGRQNDLFHDEEQK